MDKEEARPVHFNCPHCLGEVVVSWWPDGPAVMKAQTGRGGHAIGDMGHSSDGIKMDVVFVPAHIETKEELQLLLDTLTPTDATAEGRAIIEEYQRKVYGMERKEEDGGLGRVQQPRMDERVERDPGEGQEVPGAGAQDDV